MQLRTRKLLNPNICRRGYVFDNIITCPNNGFTTYCLTGNNVKSDYQSKIRKIEFGHPPVLFDDDNKNINILLLGTKGVGKTSLVITFINHILGIKPREDNCMIRIPTVGLENWITMYVFYQDTFSVTIIDTPGFSFFKEDNFDQFQTFLSRWCPTQYLLERINCIGLILRVTDQHVHPIIPCYIPNSLANITHLFITHEHNHEEERLGLNNPYKETVTYPIYAGIQAAAFHTIMYRTVHAFEINGKCSEGNCENLFRILIDDINNNNSVENWWISMFEILENRREISKLNKRISLIKHRALDSIRQGNYLLGFNNLLDSDDIFEEFNKKLKILFDNIYNLSIGNPKYEDLVPKDNRDFLQAVFLHKKGGKD